MKHANLSALERIKIVLKWLEVLLSIIVLISVVSGIPDLFRHIWAWIRDPEILTSYNAFSNFLKHVLILVVGIELVYMIISHKNESILTLVLFVIARKMLVYADGMVDILLGTVSVVLVFVAFRYFVPDEVKHGKLDGTFSASLTLRRLREDHNIHIHASDHTLGGYLFHLFEQADLPLVENAVLSDDHYIYRICKMDEGVIERVSVVRKDPVPTVHLSEETRG